MERKMPVRVDYSLYLDFVKVKFKSAIEYPGAFWSMQIAKIAGWASEVILLYLMLQRFQTVLLWSTYEVLLLYAMSVISYALAGFFMFHPFTKLEKHIRDGTFDEMLTKPLNPFLYLCCREFSLGYAANLLVGIIAMIIAFYKLSIQLTPLNFIYLVWILLGTGLVNSGIIILFSVPAFWLTKISAFQRLRSTLEAFVKYPISIYDRWIQLLLTFVIPFAFINFYPAQFFLNKSDYIGFSPALAHVTPVVGILLFLLGYLMFMLGVRSYKSTGS